LFTGGKYQSGLLELHLGRDGAKMNIGTGGANISIDNIASVLRGAQVWDLNSQIGSYANKNDFDALIALRAQFGYGDDVQKNQLYDILKGDTKLNTDIQGDFTAETVRDENGNKIVNLAGYRQGMSTEDQFLLAAILGHEAYRDGYVTSDNYLETQSAVNAHTEMALRMILGKENIAYNDNLARDISEYMSAVMTNDMSMFYNYINSNYDSSADYWKLIMGDDNIARFKWDGELTYDLTLMTGYGIVNSLDDDALLAIWNLGSDTSFDNFKNAVGTFNNLNAIVNSLEIALLDVNKKNASTQTIRNQLNDFYNALRDVGESGLLSRTDAIIANPGNGRHVFASGGGTLTCDYGIRALTWGNYGTFEKHFAWDLWREVNQRNLVAPMNGTINLDFTKEGGLNIITKGDDNQSIAYGHSSGLSLRNYIEAFSNNGVTMNLNGSLNGIVQNMVIGVMGNTGTYTTGAHVHLVYKVGSNVQDPAVFFYEGGRAVYPSTDYAKFMSGLSTATNINDMRLTNSQINNMYDYFNNINKTNATSNFMRFSRNSNNYNEFINILQKRMAL